MPVDWGNITYLPNDKIWMVPSSTYQSYEVAVGGVPEAPDHKLLDVAKRIIAQREKWEDRSRDFLWKFVDRSKMPPADEDWFADAFRFDKPKQFTIQFSHIADTYGLWTVELHEVCLSENNTTFAFHEFRRRNH